MSPLCWFSIWKNELSYTFVSEGTQYGNLFLKDQFRVEVGR